MSRTLERALVTDLSLYRQDDYVLPGYYLGYDPAKTNDASALTGLSKGVPSDKDPNPILKCRTLRDLSLSDDGIKNIPYLQQARNIIQLDSKIPITKILVDVTSHQTVLEYLKEYFGERAEGIIFTRPVKEELIQDLRVLFQEGLIEFNPKLPYFSLLRKELYELNPATLKHPEKGSDDFVWSTALAVRATKILVYNKGTASGESDIDFF